MRGYGTLQNDDSPGNTSREEERRAARPDRLPAAQRAQTGGKTVRETHTCFGPRSGNFWKAREPPDPGSNAPRRKPRGQQADRRRHRVRLRHQAYGSARIVRAHGEIDPAGPDCHSTAITSRWHGLGRRLPTGRRLSGAGADEVTVRR